MATFTLIYDVYETAVVQIHYAAQICIHAVELVRRIWVTKPCLENDEKTPFHCGLCKSRQVQNEQFDGNETATIQPTGADDYNILLFRLADIEKKL